MEVKFLKHEKSKKGIIILIVVIILAVFTVIGFNFFQAKNSGKKINNDGKMQTISIVKKDLTDSISLTGQIASVDSREVTTDLMDATVKEVKVRVGDYVNEGDILVTLDDADYLEKLNETQDETDLNALKLSQSLSLAKNKMDDASETYEREKNEAAASVSEALGELSTAQSNQAEALETYNKAVGNTEKKKEAYENLKVNEKKLKKEMNEKSKAEQQAGVAYENAMDLLENAEAKIKYTKETDEGYEALYQEYLEALENSNEMKESYETAQKASEKAKNNYDAVEQAKEEYTKSKQEEEEALSRYQEASANTEKSQNNYNKTVSNEQATNEKNADSIADSKENYTITSKEVSNSEKNQQKQLDNAKADVDSCTIFSPMTGYVTQINVEEGDSISGGSAIMIVQDLSGFIVKADVDELDIPKLVKGQKAIIKTDATGDLELEGEVSYVALTPQQASSQSSGMGDTSSSSATYKIEIALKEANENLRVGMTAKTSVVLEEAIDVLCVPYDCVDTDRDGGSYITVSEGENQKRVSVTTGMESDYYIEIQSDELAENMQVVTKTVKSESQSSGARDFMKSGSGSGFEFGGPGGPGGLSGGGARTEFKGGPR